MATVGDNSRTFRRLCETGPKYLSSPLGGFRDEIRLDFEMDFEAEFEKEFETDIALHFS